jgi:hypothetical protein
MPIDEKLFKELKPAFDYFEQYDKCGGDPKKMKEWEKQRKAATAKKAKK